MVLIGTRALDQPPLEKQGGGSKFAGDEQTHQDAAEKQGAWLLKDARNPPLMAYHARARNGATASSRATGLFSARALLRGAVDQTRGESSRGVAGGGGRGCGRRRNESHAGRAMLEEGVCCVAER
jgi:hypothetical protein